MDTRPGGWRAPDARPALDLLGITLAELTHPVVQIHVVGDDPPTEIYYENNNSTRDDVEASIAMYAPDSNVTLANQAKLEGGIIANQLALRNYSAIIPLAQGTGAITTGITPLYDEKLYRECTSEPVPAGQPPDAGC